jgi:excisionase family DNA binding protein
VNERTIYRLIKANKIPGVKIGGQWRFSEQNLQAWIEEKMETQTHPVGGPYD